MNLLQFTFSSLLWLVIINLTVVAHFWLIEIKKKSPYHIFDGFLAFLLAVGVSWYSYEELTYRIVSVIYLLLLRWVFFQLQLNLFRKKPLLYLGDDSDPDEDSFLDQLERGFKSPGAVLGLKLVLAIMCSFILMDIR